MDLTDYTKVHASVLLTNTAAFMSNCVFLSVIYLVWCGFLAKLVLWSKLAKHVTGTHGKSDSLIQSASKLEQLANLGQLTYLGFFHVRPCLINFVTAVC